MSNTSDVAPYEDAFGNVPYLSCLYDLDNDFNTTRTRGQSPGLLDLQESIILDQRQQLQAFRVIIEELHDENRALEDMNTELEEEKEELVEEKAELEMRIDNLEEENEAQENQIAKFEEEKKAHEENHVELTDRLDHAEAVRTFAEQQHGPLLVVARYGTGRKGEDVPQVKKQEPEKEPQEDAETVDEGNVKSEKGGPKKREETASKKRKANDDTDAFEEFVKRSRVRENGGWGRSSATLAECATWNFSSGSSKR